MGKNRIHWVVEGCRTGDVIIVSDGARSTKITVLALYGRCLLGKTRYGSPMTVNYASLYAQQRSPSGSGPTSPVSSDAGKRGREKAALTGAAGKLPGTGRHEFLRGPYFFPSSFINT